MKLNEIGIEGYPKLDRNKPKKDMSIHKSGNFATKIPNIYQIKYLNTIIGYCKGRQIKVMLVNTPSYLIKSLIEEN